MSAEPTDLALSSAMASRAHLERVVAKLSALIAARDDTFDQLLEVLGRCDLSEDDKVDWWLWLRALPPTPLLSAPITRLAQSMGTNLAQLRRWFENADLAPRTSGLFPLDRQCLPRDGQFCVYLLTWEGQVLYVGASRNIRSRLKQHWKGEKKPFIDGWQVVLCASEQEMLALEGDLIFQHQPRMNRADRARRRFRP